MFLLDTNACIAFLKQRSLPLAEKVRHYGPDAIRLCSIVKAELWYGAHKSSQKEGNFKRLALLFTQFQSVDFNDGTIDTYARIRTELEQRGQVKGPLDLLIAAIACQHDLTLVTNNTREFSRIAILRWEDWQTS